MGELLHFIYRMFLRVLPRAGYSRFGLLGVHPRRRLGGTGGPVAPVRGVWGDTLPRNERPGLGSWDFIYFQTPLPVGEGVGVGPHKSLLDLLVRTDTVGVGRGFKGDPMVPITCDFCGLPIRRCVCRAGKEY